MSQGASCQIYLISPAQFELEAFTPRLESALKTRKVAVFQLRMKPASDIEVEEAARVLMEICHKHDVMFILNDHPHIAKRIGADGVHLGDEDMSVANARELLGSDVTIGASCYGSMDRAMMTGQEGADYVAFGAFYETKTKEPKGRPEPEILTRWIEQATLPCVAIGGITDKNCEPLVKAGADFIAIVSYVWEHPEGEAKAVEDLAAAIEKA